MDAGQQARSEVGQHRLTTIAFTDVVGYVALADRDESRALALVRRDLAIIAGACARYGGRVMKNMGDGLLMCFDSAESAVSCAVELQRSFGEGGAKLPPGESLQHRVGIHLGDVLITPTDLLGSDVNIASRLLAEADPGGVCISQTVYEVVKHKKGLRGIYLGPRELKNLREAVPAYRLVIPLGDDGQAVEASDFTGIPKVGGVAVARRGKATRVAAVVGSTAAAVALCIALWSAWAGRHPVAVEARQNHPTSARTALFGPGDWVDLLPYVKPEKHGGAGVWTITGSTLAVTTDSYTWLVIPVVPEGDYDVEVSFKRDAGERDVVIYAPLGQTQTTLQFGYSGKYDMLSDQWRDTAIRNGKVYTAVLSVDRSGSEVALKAAIPGAPPLTLTRDASLLRPFSRNWVTPYPQALGLGCDKGSVEFLSCRVRMRSGRALPLGFD